MKQWPRTIRWIVAIAIGASAATTAYMLIYRGCIVPLARWRWNVEYAETGTEPSTQLWVMAIMMALMPLSAALAGTISVLLERDESAKFSVLLTALYGVGAFIFLKRFPVFAATIALGALLGCYLGRQLLKRRTRLKRKSASRQC